MTPDGGGAAAACAVAIAAASSASMAARVPTAATPSSGVGGECASRCTRDAKKLLNALIVGMVAAFAVKSVPTFDGSASTPPWLTSRSLAAAVATAAAETPGLA